ncbi:MAG: amidohydrolase family protein [Victivallales bacterium]|nr:amidohydrolase family protein [Victivallales bacterium]
MTTSRRVFDFHVHCYPEKVAERAIGAVGPLGLHPSFDGTMAGLKRSMTEAGITASLNLPLANTPKNIRGINAWAAANNAAPVYSLGSIHPADPHPDRTLSWIRSLGLKGIKLHPEYQRFRIDDPRLHPIWEGCIANGLFVLTHAGNDIAFDPPANSNPAMLAELHRRYPALTLVLAHLGSWGMWQDVETHLAGLPVYLDLAFTLGSIDDELLLRIIARHGAAHILFGTDAPWQSQRESLEKFLALPLREEEKELILYDNAARLLGLQ